MKQIISKTMMLIAMAAMVSFTNYGGEGYEISLNNKVMIQQFGKPEKTVKSLQLNQYSANDQLRIKYHHCGHIGKNRIIAIKDGQNKLLRQWRFSDGATPPAAMVCNVKDILDLSKAKETVLKMYYASNELPNGRLLTTIVVNNTSVARNR